MQDDFEIELRAMFADGDARLTADPFVQNTRRRIRRMELARRAVLALVATVGVLIIGSQLPALAGALSGVEAMPSLVSSSLDEGLGRLVEVDPLWLAVGASLFISLMATFLVEQV